LEDGKFSRNGISTESFLWNEPDPLSSLLSLTIVFLLTISRPPRGVSENKKLLHTFSNFARWKSPEQALMGTLSRLACSPAGCLLVTSGFCRARLADSAPGIGGLACKPCYLADYSAQTVWIALDARDTRVAVGRELTKSNLLSDRPQTLPFETGQPQNKP
jgi:hypothetical protein